MLKIIFRMEKIRIMELLLHCADISNCVKPWNIHTKFTGELLEEFFKQVGRLPELLDSRKYDIPNKSILRNIRLSTISRIPF